MRLFNIGKDTANDHYKDFINDPSVSRNHCQIFEDDNGNVFLTDLKSTNGTFVNGNKISNPVILKKYDIVKAGNSLVNWKQYLYDGDKPKINKEVSDDILIEKPSNAKKSKAWIIILFIIIIIFFVGYNLNKDGSDSSNDNNKSVNRINEKINNDVIEDVKNKIITPTKINYPRPKNGFSPYDQYFGKGIYNNNSGNEFVIKNSNSTDAVVLLVDAFSKKKIRNEYVRKGNDFKMTGVPNGTYYIEWFSGNDWSPNLKVASKYKGGFRKDASFTKTRDRSDWMPVKGYQQWTITLYNVTGGDVASEKIDEDDFFN